MLSPARGSLVWLCHGPKTKDPLTIKSWRLGLQVPVPLSGEQHIGSCFFVFMAPTPSRVHDLRIFEGS